MILDLLTFDPGCVCETPSAYADEVARLVRSSWESGADIVLLPEFTWMGLEAIVPQKAEDPSIYHTISDLFWQTLLPNILDPLSSPGKAVVMGTAPYFDRNTHRVFNRAPILVSGKRLYQDKLHLTPWENDFHGGDVLQIWEFQGFKIAVVICLDIEIPEISTRLRGHGVDLILCPSATETILGVERVDRCASARAVELGCHVAVAHLTGRAQSQLIDENIGRLAFYSPSQASFRKAPRWIETEIYESGVHSLRITLDPHPLAAMRRMTMETNPSHLGKDSAGHFTIHQVQF